MMNYQKENQIESLLNQMQLSQPSSQLDKSIEMLADDREVVSRPYSVQFSWFAIATTALAASIIGLLAGATSSPKYFDGTQVSADSTHDVSQTQIFLTMHGHSGNTKFQDCSACHDFKTNAEQTINKWFWHEGEANQSLGLPNCAMCHLLGDEIPATALGSKG